MSCFKIKGNKVNNAALWQIETHTLYNRFGKNVINFHIPQAYIAYIDSLIEESFIIKSSYIAFMDQGYFILIKLDSHIEQNAFFLLMMRNVVGVS